jgi:hypothetical protein
VLCADGVSSGLRLAWGGPGAWEYETLAAFASSGSWVRCCTLESGELFAVWYYTLQGHSLMTAQGRPGASWQIVSREFLGELEKKRDMGLGLALDPSGNPWVAFVRVNASTPRGILRLMFPTIPRSTKDIDYEDTTSSVGASCDITVDSSGQGHLAFFRTNNMSLRNRRWSLEAGRSGLSVMNADIGISEGISLLVGDGGEVAAFFRSGSGKLCRKIFSNDIWSASVVLDAGANTGGFATSLRDSHGKSYVFYSGGTDGGVRLLTDRTGVWEIHVVDPDSVLGSRCAAALSGDAVLVSYWDALSKAVKLLYVGNTPPSTPSDPDPADGSEPASAPKDLSWAACSDDENDGVTYSVYASDARWKIDALEEDALVLSGEPNCSADVPETLKDSSPVYWRVVATDSYGSAREGPTWSYAVLPTPSPSPEPSSTPTPTVSPVMTPTSAPAPTTSPTPVATGAPTPVVVPSAMPTGTPEPSLSPTSVPTPTHAPTHGPGPTSNPEPSPSRSPTPTSLVPSPVAGNAESKAGCDATGGSLVVLMLLAPLLLPGPLDRK